MLRLELSAWLAHVEGRREAAVALMREAAEIEASTPKAAVTPGPNLPAPELLGDLLIEQKQPADALVAYKRSMEAFPRRFNGWLGAARAAPAVGDAPQARALCQEVLQASQGSTRLAALEEARSYLSPAR